MSRRVLRLIGANQPTYPTELKKVYEWASMLTMETKRYFEEGDFFLTSSVKRLIFKLENLKQGLIGVIGLQGVGKTSTLNFVSERFIDQKLDKKTLLLSWSSETLELLKDDFEVEDHYEANAYHQAVEKAKRYASANRPLLGRVPDQFSISDIKEKRTGFEGVELMLGTAECEKLKEEAVFEYLSDIDYLFIDLPDYSKKHRGDMNRDLRAVETLWKRVSKGDEDATPQVLVLGIQKEMFGGHFFFGKMDVVELEPLKPEELVLAYQQKWKTFDVITEDALLYVAQLSRGVFRRFLKYLQRCIEETATQNKTFPITIETVKTTITTEQLAKDMDLELADLFKTKEQKLNCVNLLSLLRERQEANQRQIAEALDINDMAVSRMIKTLEAYGYIKRKRALRGEWLISLA